MKANKKDKAKANKTAIKEIIKGNVFKEKTKTAKAVLETAIGLDSIKEDANLIH